MITWTVSERQRFHPTIYNKSDILTILGLVNGFIDVSKEDLDHLLSNHGVLLQSNPPSGTNTPGRAEKNIRNNNFDGGFVVTGPMCLKEVDPWRDANYTCDGNVTKSDAFVLLHAQPNMDVLNAMLKAKVESDKARYAK